MIKPVFIFSLPRSGSTLLQRVLMSHSRISSTAEPWLLLPLVGMLKEQGTLSIYSHRTSQAALTDLTGHLRGGRAQYDHLLREFVCSLYDSASREGSVYFLDKTPRYYQIIPEIAALFPEAKFIFLFRNPLHVYASIVTTWGHGTLRRLFYNTMDLEEGPDLLAQGYAQLKDCACALNYEDFVLQPEQELRRVLRYLGLDEEEGMLSRFAGQRPGGRFGDPTGAQEYSTVATASLDKWQSVFNNRFRQRLVKNYILRMPESTLALQGYDKQDILKNINEIEVLNTTPVRDYIHYYRSLALLWLKAHLFLTKAMRWTDGKYLE